MDQPVIGEHGSDGGGIEQVVVTFLDEQIAAPSGCPKESARLYKKRWLMIRHEEM